LNAGLPGVTVIVPAYNARRTIGICLRALERQDYPQDRLQVIVVDDGSTDGTSDGYHYLKLPGNFTMIQHAENRGLATARNTGIRNAQGEILIFLDADMEVGRDFIARHVAHYSKPAVIGIVSAIEPAPALPRDKYQRYIYESRRGARGVGPGHPLPFQYFIFGMTSVRKSALMQIGGFDVGIRQYGGEDTEMAYRLWRRFPLGLYYDPAIKVVHHHYRSLPQVLQAVRDFGRQVLPYLAKKNPEVTAVYGGKYINFEASENLRPHFWVGRLWRSRVILNCLMLLYEILPYPVSNLAIRGLLAWALIDGAHRGLKRRPE